LAGREIKNPPVCSGGFRKIFTITNITSSCPENRHENDEDVIE
jgi:hypothetical protein